MHNDTQSVGVSIIRQFSMEFSIMACRIATFSITILRKMVPRIMVVSITIVCIITFCIAILSIMTLSI